MVMDKWDKKYHFLSSFDTATGMYVRSGVIRDGEETQKDPFMASFPELLDVGIMGHCEHGRAGLCLKAGVECYQDGMHKIQPDMTVENFRRIAEECRGRVFQIALGGRGDPNRHEHFEEILRLCRANEIVPNYTTSGFLLDERAVELSRRYCGAVAVSWYRSEDTLRAVRMFLEAGVKTNIHFVLSRDSLEEAIQRLRDQDFPRGINAVVFLLHKPVGLGSEEKMLRYDDPGLAEFFRLAVKTNYPFKIGFDSCSLPGMLHYMDREGFCDCDTCEGARWSAYISPDMYMMPCSFDSHEKWWSVSLEDHTLEEAWNSAAFEDFRDRLRNACPGCSDRGICMGGCPIVPECVLCDRGTRMKVYPAKELAHMSHEEKEKLIERVRPTMEQKRAAWEKMDSGIYDAGGNLIGDKREKEDWSYIRKIRI